MNPDNTIIILEHDLNLLTIGDPTNDTGTENRYLAIPTNVDELRRTFGLMTIDDRSPSPAMHGGTWTADETIPHLSFRRLSPEELAAPPPRALPIPFRARTGYTGEDSSHLAGSTHTGTTPRAESPEHWDFDDEPPYSRVDDPTLRVLEGRRGTPIEGYNYFDGFYYDSDGNAHDLDPPYPSFYYTPSQSPTLDPPSPTLDPPSPTGLAPFERLSGTPPPNQAALQAPRFLIPRSSTTTPDHTGPSSPESTERSVTPDPFQEILAEFRDAIASLYTLRDEIRSNIDQLSPPPPPNENYVPYQVTLLRIPKPAQRAHLRNCTVLIPDRLRPSSYFRTTRQTAAPSAAEARSD
ncbi:hypothetical protein K466DRAFT_607743 [Polyporus arcularius HHB13444]|uniref:Uncharacterized protein n=1 Tax=Polyporus arcularius HHB13444 TaxID=1314778 RepID=A0A5C3NKM2_9APHY|nr:hypothetical protein K466DRAFT_607743 [Polyporus arcularius HHB13444]